MGRIPSLLLLLMLVGCGRQAEVALPELVSEPLDSPAGEGSGESNLAVSPDGRVILSWLEPEGSGHALRFSALANSGWTPAATVARGEAWFVNWADFPSVVPISDRLWAAHWLARRPEGGYAYDVAMALSNDAGASWGATLSPHTDGTPTEHGFVTLFPWQGAVGAVWLDGRNMQPGEAGDHAAHAHGAGGMTLRAAVIDASGALSHEFVVDELTCDCCQTDVAVTAAGPIVAYRDRSVDEIRDIFVARGTADGWSTPLAVANDGWRIEGCPVNGPAIAAQAGHVVVAWFTAAGDVPRVRMARSVDGGRSFASPLDLDIEAPLGRVGVVLLSDGDAVVSWLAAAGEGAAVALRRVRRDGGLGPVRIVTHTAASRPAGFPQLVVSGEHLVLSWTEVVAENKRVRTARVPVTGI